jgi:hypothetical protein
LTKAKHSDLSGLEAPTVHKRRLTGHRDCRRALRKENAREAIGDLYAGCEIYGFTKGQFCLVHILEHCLDRVGPGADVDISTWSAASGDIQAAYRMMRLNMRRLRFLVDFSFQSRKPKFCAELIETFGYDALRVTSVHAKFMTIRREPWNLVIRTSMNLNYNPRFENFEISDDPAMCDFMTAIMDEIWASQRPAEGFDARPSDNVRAFEGLWRPEGVEVVNVRHMETVSYAARKKAVAYGVEAGQGHREGVENEPGGTETEG